MSTPYVQPQITDADIHWACRHLGLPDTAFHGVDGKDARAPVLKLSTTADVAACPGSGKTTLLVAKLAILANKWSYPTKGICVLSHTNVAREEIGKRLGDCLAGQQLLGYPHFVGTIHSFVNEFLAVPWLRSLGYPIKAIDSEITAARRWSQLDRGARYFLEKKKFSQFDLVAISPDFSVGGISIGTGTPTYQEMVRVCTQSAKDGYFSHSEMFVWARDFLAKHPEMIAVLRQRFPTVFIDECQDNDDEQSQLIYQLFCQGASPSVCQRFGDANQAIFSNVETESPTAAEYCFPLAAIKHDLPNSHRFGQRIADFADPLGLVPSKLKGDGPKKQLASKAEHAEHTIFLFKDKAGATQVLPRFGELLLATFSNAELQAGVFKAVGQVHKPRSDEIFPAHVGHYWPSYQPGLAKLEPRAATFVEGVALGLANSRRSFQVGTCAQKFADCILEAVHRTNATFSAPKRENRHRLVRELLAGDPTLQAEYQKLVEAIALEGACTKQNWETTLRARVGAVVQHIANAKLSTSATEYLDWPKSGIEANAPVGEKPHPNIYRHVAGGREVSVQIGSIHSVKGETHTATLLVETYYNELNIDSIKDWLLGNKVAAKKNGKRINARLKLHYVALTRPAHLACIAMQHSSFETGGVLDQAQVKQLEGRGWKVRVI